MDSQSESELKSELVGHSKSMGNSQSNALNFTEMALMQLKQYQDIEQDDDLLLMEDEGQPNEKSVAVGSYMHFRTNCVPIGTNFQAQIPSVMPAFAYKNKSKNAMEKLKRLKVHDPDENPQFYNQNRELIQKYFGQDRTYEDSVELYNNFKQFPLKCLFPQYLAYNPVMQFWDNYFKSKDKAFQFKNKKKKKKNKGTIPV